MIDWEHIYFLKVNKKSGNYELLKFPVRPVFFPLVAVVKKNAVDLVVADDDLNILSVLNKFTGFEDIYPSLGRYFGLNRPMPSVENLLLRINDDLSIDRYPNNGRIANGVCKDDLLLSMDKDSVIYIDDFSGKTYFKGANITPMSPNSDLCILNFFGLNPQGTNPFTKGLYALGKYDHKPLISSTTTLGYLPAFFGHSREDVIKSYSEYYRLIDSSFKIPVIKVWSEEGIILQINSKKAVWLSPEI